MPLRKGKLAVVSVWVLGVLALTVSALNLFFWIHATTGRAELDRDVEQKQSRLGGLDRELGVVRRSLDAPAAERLIERLIALERSGALGAVGPEEVLSFLAEELPEGVRILSVELEAGPPTPELRMAAEVEAPHLVAELLSGLARSPMVAQTSIQQEVHRGDGEVQLRIEAQLRPMGEWR
jgi:hypothetical protein